MGRRPPPDAISPGVIRWAPDWAPFLFSWLGCSSVRLERLFLRPGLLPERRSARSLSNARSEVERPRSHAQAFGALAASAEHGEEQPFDRRAREGMLRKRRGRAGGDLRLHDRLANMQPEAVSIRQDQKRAQRRPTLWQVTSGAAPFTVLSTNAGTVFQQSQVSSTPFSPSPMAAARRRSVLAKLSASDRVRPLPPPRRAVQPLRPGTDLLLPGLRSGGSPPVAARGRQTLRAHFQRPHGAGQGHGELAEPQK